MDSDSVSIIKSCGGWEELRVGVWKGPLCAWAPHEKRPDVETWYYNCFCFWMNARDFMLRSAEIFITILAGRTLIWNVAIAPSSTSRICSRCSGTWLA